MHSGIINFIWTINCFLLCRHAYCDNFISNLAVNKSAEPGMYIFIAPDVVSYMAGGTMSLWNANYDCFPLSAGLHCRKREILKTDGNDRLHCEANYGAVRLMFSLPASVTRMEKVSSHPGECGDIHFRCYRNFGSPAMPPSPLGWLAEDHNENIDLRSTSNRAGWNILLVDLLRENLHHMSYKVVNESSFYKRMHSAQAKAPTIEEIAKWVCIFRGLIILVLLPLPNPNPNIHAASLAYSGVEGGRWNCLLFKGIQILGNYMLQKSYHNHINLGHVIVVFSHKDTPLVEDTFKKWLSDLGVTAIYRNLESRDLWSEIIFNFKRKHYIKCLLVVSPSYVEDMERKTLNLLGDPECWTGVVSVHSSPRTIPILLRETKIELIPRSLQKLFLKVNCFRWSRNSDDVGRFWKTLLRQINER